VNLTRRKILIVDDDQSVRTVVKIALEDTYDVTATASAISALQYLSEHKVDLVVLDINMPGMCGIEALGEIRKRHPEIAVVMLTAYASRENMQKAASFGAYGFILKPFDLDSLLNYIDAAVNFKNTDKVHDSGPVNKTMLQ
jgi:DNA-binding NtrC family response regulator